MLVQVVSDLHAEIRGLDSTFEVLSRARKDAKADVLVMAGDICNWKDQDVVHEILENVQQEWPHTIWVPGNHEFYGASPKSAIDSLEETIDNWGPFPNVDIFYHPGDVTIFGQRFIVGTGWYGDAPIENLPGDPDAGTFWEHGHLYQWSDFRKITGLAPFPYEEFTYMRKELLEKLSPTDIVVTHMLPSLESSPRQFLGAATNTFFVSGFEDLIVSRQPKLWIHGHTHTPCDYWFGATNIVCNPLGSPNERHLDAYKAVVVEV